MIDIIHSNYDIDTNNINELLLDKFITSFDGIIRENTKKLYYNNQQDNLNQINNNSSISFIYVNTNYNNDTKFIDDLIVDLNSIKKSIKIRLDLFNCDYSNIVRYFDNKNSNITLVLKKHKNSFVVFDDNNIESLISPFKNKDMMYLYEKYYLPTTLTIPMLQKGMNDFTIFKYVNKVRIEKYHPNVKTFIKLPRTIQKFDSFICYETAINDIQITNWNDLILLKKINHYSNLDIPYPQIKYVSIKKQLSSFDWPNLIITSIPFMCLLTLLLLLCFFVSSLSYINSLYLYTSKWFILTTGLLIPPSIIPYLLTVVYMIELDIYVIVKYMKLLFKNWVSTTTLFHCLSNLGKYYLHFVVLSFGLLILQIIIGSFISFFYTSGSISYYCLGSSISFLGLSVSLVIFAFFN
ncbi:hypothetical protein QTN25_006358 [Entamoeba marina]